MASPVAAGPVLGLSLDGVARADAKPGEVRFQLHNDPTGLVRHSAMGGPVDAL
jgi:hypothetical protein